MARNSFIPIPSHVIPSHPTVPPPLRASDRSNVVACFMPDFMHCMAFEEMQKECSIQGRASFPGLPLPSRDQSVAFSMPSGVILLHVFHTLARGAWLRAGQSLVEGFSKQWKVDLKQESGVGLQGFLAKGRGRGAKGKSSSPSLRRRSCPCPLLLPLPLPQTPLLLPFPFVAMSLAHVIGPCNVPQQTGFTRAGARAEVFCRALQTLFC